MSADEAQFDNILLALAEKHRGGVPDVSIFRAQHDGTKEHAPVASFSLLIKYTLYKNIEQVHPPLLIELYTSPDQRSFITPIYCNNNNKSNLTHVVSTFLSVSAHIGELSAPQDRLLYRCKAGGVGKDAARCVPQGGKAGRSSA